MISVTLGSETITSDCTYQAATPNYTCIYQVTGSETAGATTIGVSATDASGNTANNSATVTLDFTSPVLSAGISPAVVNDTNGPPVLSVTSTKALLNPPSVTSITASSGATGSVTAASAVAVTGTSWTFGLTPAAGTVGTFTVNVSGTDTDGHGVSTSASVVIDNVTPTVSTISTYINTGTVPSPTLVSATTFSQQSPYNVIYAQFNWAAGTSGAPAVISVTLGSETITSDCTYQAATPNYTCIYR